jgi:hypothetical protein
VGSREATRLARQALTARSADAVHALLAPLAKVMSET